MDTVWSINGVPIRLTIERWFHIVENYMLIDFPKQKFSVDYDPEADVLYVSFYRPQRATNSVLTDDGFILRYRDDQLVGITVLDASTRAPVSN